MNRIRSQLNIIIQFFHIMIPDQKRHLLLAFFAGLSGVYFNLTVSFFLKGTYKAVTLLNQDTLISYICFFILLLAGTFVYNCYCWSLYGSSTAQITGRIRMFILNKLCSLPLFSVERGHSADVLTLFTHDLDAVQNIYGNIRAYVIAIMSGLIPTLLILNISIDLAILILLLGVLQLIINLAIIHQLQRMAVEIRSKILQLNSIFSDIVRNHISIRLYYSEDYYSNLSHDIIQSLYRSNRKQNTINSMITSLNIGFGLLGYIIVLIIGSKLINNNKLNLPDLLFITQMRLLMIQGILAFGDYVVGIQPGVTAAEKILTFIKQKNEGNL